MLNITGLAKTYGGGIQALKGVDLAVPSGMFGLLGPNGSGKTTLMKIAIRNQLVSKMRNPYLRARTFFARRNRGRPAA